MAFTFNPALTTPVSRVRQLLGDTEQSGHLTPDETITARLIGRTELQAAAQVARDLAARFAQKPDWTVDGQGIRYSQRYEQFRDLAKDLERQAASELTPPPVAPTAMSGFGGGIIVGGLDDGREPLPPLDRGCWRT